MMITGITGARDYLTRAAAVEVDLVVHTYIRAAILS